MIEDLNDNKNVKGYRAALAKAASCTTSFISQVLNNEADLTPDHASALADFWNLDPLASDYFLTLVMFQRANSTGLKDKLRQKLYDMGSLTPSLTMLKSEELQIDGRLVDKYASRWYFCAIHLSLSLLNCDNPKAIAERLTLPLPVVEDGLDLLKKMKLVEEIDKKWRILEHSFALHNDGPAEVFTSSLRLKSFEALHIRDRDELRFGAICALPRSDFIELRKSIVAFIKEKSNMTMHSQVEELFGISLDIFKL
ncbi:MAG: DUF4423 domain-containing protein [Proteobacteria bacterium]|nr:MAG: DUF4423 domain-containing protein [Pseudomonadota bacterium]